MEMTTKPCNEMTNSELADFIDMGAWREHSHEHSHEADSSAYSEAAKRLRMTAPEFYSAKKEQR